MGWTRQWAGYGLCLWTALAGADIAAADAGLTVVLHIDNRAGVSEQDLERAQVELERVFGPAGVAIEWSNTGLAGAMRESTATTGRRHLVMMLMNAGLHEPRHAGGCPLGFAIPQGAIAYVFYNRLLNLSRSQPVDLDVMLGRVIAHEAGHLLLPSGRHPNFGIMRATLDLTVKNPSRFTDGEAKSMQDGLAQSRHP